MKLTNHLRAAFVRAVMNDVPSVDYEAEQQRIATEWAVSIMPLAVRRVWDDKFMRHYVATYPYSQSLDFDDYLLWVSGFEIPAPQDLHSKMPVDVQRLLYDLEAKEREQRAHCTELREKLYSIVAGITTTKGLEKALPEFAKYVPKDDKPTDNLPALANVVADFMKAGWPKEQTA